MPDMSARFLFSLPELPMYEWLNLGILFAIPAAVFILAPLMFHVKTQEDTPAPNRSYPTGGDAAAAGLIVIMLVLLYAFGQMSAAFAEKESMSHESGSGCDMILSQVVMAFLMLPGLVRAVQHPAPPVFRPNKLAWFFGGLSAIYIFSFFLNLSGLSEWIHEALDAPLEQQVAEEMGQGSWKIQLLSAASAIVIAPVLEETFFRGYLYPVLRKYTNVPFALIAVSLFFGAIHLSIVHFLPLAFVGLILNLAYEKTHCIRLSIAMHASFNTLSVLVIHLAP